MKTRIRITGIMPERALLRIRRTGAPLYNVRKETSTSLVCTVRKKDLEKIFAIYPKVCYTIYGQSPYAVQTLGDVGVWKWLVWAKRRVGFILGAMLFCIGSLGLNACVLGVQFIGSDVYQREAVMALEENGIRVFAPYPQDKADVVCAKLLRLKGVEFCSVKKTGLYVCVEMHVNEERLTSIRAGAFKAKRSGTVLAITALSGTALKKDGDSVKKGETLIDGYFVTPSGEKQQTTVIGRVTIACVYQTTVQTTDEESAFATAYLSAGLGENDYVTSKEITPAKQGFAVRICYTATESFNL